MTSSPTLPPGGGAGCGSAGRPPTASTGPAAGLVTVNVDTGGGATSGSPMAVATTLLVRADGPRILLHAAQSALYVLSGSTVVAVARDSGGPDIPLPLTAGKRWPAQTVPDALPLRDCDGAALAAGTYRLVAVVGYGGDPLNGNPAGAPGSFTLVSTPTAFSVR